MKWGLAPIFDHKIYLLLFLGKQRNESFYYATWGS